jgi:flagellum-specific peptidoglycan hydrolase FlgJ
MALDAASSVSSRPSPVSVASKGPSAPSAPSSTGASKAASTPRFSGELGFGSRGRDVSHLQETLRGAGFNPGKTDGIFGPKTQAALRNFQTARGIQVDGIAGPETFGALRDSDSFQPAQKPATPAKPGTQTQPGTQPGSPQAGGTQSTAPITGVPKTGNAFIDRIASDAIKSQRETGVPASVTMAQAILESGWGKSGLSTQANNFFGIKGKGPAGSVTMRTREVFNGQSTYINAPFRKYNSPAESFADHGRFFTQNKRYATAMQHTNDAHRFAREIARAGYATDPKYASMLSGLINKHGLERFDRIARGQ